jgi:hypothetical protein
MVGMWKQVQEVLAGLLADMPEGLKVLTEFVYRVRWFIVWGVVAVGMYNVVMVALPYLMWSFIIKMVVGSIFSFISL